MSIYIFFTLGKQIVQTFGSNYLRKYFFILLFLFWGCFSPALLSQTLRNFSNPERVDENIKTVRFHRQGWPMSYPLIELNSNQKLVLSFDELGTEIKNYHYSIEFCDEDWSSSQLMRTEYFRGNEFLTVEDYRRSFNTTFDYVHYELVFPNNEASVLKSGNYLIKVFENFDRDNPLLVKRFMVNEQKVTIEPDVKYTMQSTGRNHYQEIDFEVSHPGITIMDPANEIKVTVIQNGRTDNAVTGLPPLFFGNDKMDFNYNREVVMEGGNEFRWVDLRSFRFQSDHIEDITFSDPFYHVDVFTDQAAAGKPYYYHQDFNGRYYIEVQEEQDPDVSSDYAFVHFSLKWEPPLGGKEVYLMGGLTNWMLNDENRMKYDFENDSYTLTLLLKQGYYNYQFLVKGQSDSIGSVMPIEGSFGRTENDYLILVYYRSAGARYDRLIGAEVANSVNR
ncbi:type IX secretion system plug protein [Marinilabilia rubra]|uniref:DUF5103 domain-containing protein n=1 Tax=Marinilabilia rubra TaxID=2162893 RepID=A0A2U2BA71_9BACT|nr:type IX secretion system plug protein domain-containing protein [Marinilabilia rubra]PWD99933.1 DUF5103 domain-containing protein [Marinilabilia rubra]